VTTRDDVTGRDNVTTRDDSLHMNAGARNLVRHLTPERGFDLIRIYLGVGLTVRGVLFFMDPSWLGHMLEPTGAPPLLPRLIAIGHMAGGALLSLGLFTRWAAAIQILPVLGAVIVVHLRDDLGGQNQSLEFSALVLVMLVFFACFGAGQWSLDQQRRSRVKTA
jgi:putative oxidoreductase